MATIARLIIAMGTDPTGLHRGLNAGINEIKQFARSANQIGTKSNIFGDLNTPARRAAEQAVQTLKNTMAVKLTGARENLAKGIIDAKQFKAAAQAAAVEFNSGLRAELDRLGNRKDFTNRINAGLVSQFLNIGDDSGKAFAAGFSRITQLTRSLGLATRRIGTELTAAITVPIIAAAAAAIKFSRDFNKSMANVQSLIPGSQARVVELREAVRSLSLKTGQGPADLAQGLYQLISAFGDSADSAKLLDINARAAVGGLSTVSDAVNLTSAVTRAYGDTSVAAVQKVADLATLAVRLGKTTFPDLAQAIGRATPLAASLGVSMEELFATMATGSGVTGDVSEVSTQLRGIFQSLQSPTETMSALFSQLGVQSGAAAIKQLGFIGVVKAVVQSANASGRSLQDYISQIEGQTLALNLAGAQAGVYDEKLRAMDNSAGATTAAFLAQTEGINASGHALDVVARQFEAIAQKLGEALGPSLLKAVPAITSVVNTLAGMVTAFGNLSPTTQEFLITMTGLAVAFGPVIHIAGTLITTVAAVARTLFLARTAGLTFATAMGLVTSPILGTLAVLAGLVALVLVFRKELTSVNNTIQDFIARIIEGARNIPVIGGALASVLETLAGPAAKLRAELSGKQVAQAYNAGLAKNLTAPSAVAAPAIPPILRGAGARATVTLKPIILVDPKEIAAQVQTAVDRLNLFQEAGKSIAAPFQDLLKLQGQINERLAAGKLTIEEENQLTRALVTVRKTLGDAAGTSVDALSNKIKLTIEQLTLAKDQGLDLAPAMRTVQDVIDIINKRMDGSILSLKDQNQLTRDLVTARAALTEASKPDTRAFDAFSKGATDALAQLQSLKAAAQFEVQLPTSDAGTNLDRLIATQFLLNGAGQAYERQLVTIKTDYANILGVIQSTIAPTKEQLDLARQLGAALQEAARIQVLKSTSVGAQNLLSQLGLAANSYADVVAALQLAREAHDKSAEKAAKNDIKALHKQAIDLQKQIAEMVKAGISTGIITPAGGDAILERMRDLMKSMGVDMSGISDKTAEWVTHLNDVGQKVANIIDGVAGILDGLGAIDSQTRKVVEGLSKIAKNAAGAAAGDPSSIIAVIGGLVQTIGGLFGGKSPEEKERDRINAGNQVILLRIAKGIEDLSGVTASGAQFAKLKDVFKTITNPAQFRLEDNTKLGSRVGALLAANGLDIEDVKRTAAELGLTFQNTAQFYRDFAQALQQADLTRFADTFTGQMDKLAKSFEILGITDPAEKLRQTIKVLTDPKVGSPALRKALEGVDVSTAAGLKDFQARIASLFANFENLTPADLGGLTATQFLDQLASAAGLSRDALEQLTGSVAAATHEMLNVPTGFRQARAEFLAQGNAASAVTPVTTPPVNVIAQTVADVQSLTPTEDTPVTNRLDQIRDALTAAFPQAGDAAKGKDLKQAIYQITVAAGAFTLASDGRPAKNQVDDFLTALRQKANATTGDSNQIGNV